MRKQHYCQYRLRGRPLQATVDCPVGYKNAAAKVIKNDDDDDDGDGDDDDNDDASRSSNRRNMHDTCAESKGRERTSGQRIQAIRPLDVIILSPH